MILLPGLSVVIPVYKSRDSLPILHRRLRECLSALAPGYEIILVEDGGQDGSWECIRALAGSDPCVRGIKLSRNYGQHNALLCGIRAATRDITVTLDDDLQTPPEEIPKLLAKLNDGYDLVYGAPERPQHGFFRIMASTLTKLALQDAMGAGTAEKSGPFRVFRTRLREAFNHFDSPFLSLDVLLTWGGARFSHVKVRHDPRLMGASNYTLGKLVNHALNMITGFSTLPLRLASWVGFASTFLGIAILFYVVGRYLLEGTTVAGFPFLASIVAIFSGAQLFALGIIGEYLARMHQRSMAKPAYLVETAAGFGSVPAEGSPAWVPALPSTPSRPEA